MFDLKILLDLNFLKFENVIDFHIDYSCNNLVKISLCKYEPVTENYEIGIDIHFEVGSSSFKGIEILNFNREV